MQLTVVVQPETADWLRARNVSGRGIGHVVDDLVTRAMSRDDPAEYDEVG